jgi:hypothetical protein
MKPGPATSGTAQSHQHQDAAMPSKKSCLHHHGIICLVIGNTYVA